jgi:ATP-binding cassette subfamily C protein
MTPFLPETANPSEAVVEPRGSQPAMPFGPGTAWIVRKGRVDLFLAPFHAPETPGARSHVARIEEGRTLLGMDAAALPRGWTLLAEPGPGTRLERVDAEAVSLRAVEEWAILLAGAAARDKEPKEFQPVGPGDTFEVPENPLPLAARGRLVWVRHLRGEGRFLGNAKIAPVAGDGYFPLARPAWLEEQPGNVVSVASTEEAFCGDGQSAGLGLYHRVVCQALVFARKMAEAKDRARLTARQSADDARLDASLRQVTAPLRLGGNTDLPVQAGNPLLKACQAIGAVQGISFQAPPEMLRGLPMRDPVGALCRSSGARSRRVALDESCYRREGQPLLAYRQSDRRPLALLPRRSRGYCVYDPVDGSRTKADRELLNSLEPFAYGFYGGFPPRPIGLKDLCLFGLNGCWRDVALVVLLALFVGLLGMVLPILTRHVFDEIIPSGQRNRLIEVGVFILAVSLASAMLGLTRGFALLRIENKVDAKVQAAIWSRMLSLPSWFFRQFSSGDLASRATAISAIRQMLTASAMSTIFSGIFSAGNFALLFYYSIPLALLATALTVVQLTAFLACALYQLQILRAGVGVQGRLVGMLLQLIGNISKFRVAAAENRAFMAWSRIFVAYRTRMLRSVRVSNWLAVFSRAFMIVASMAIFWATTAVIASPTSSSFTTGDFMAFIAAYGSFSGALMTMGQVVVGLLAIVPMYQRSKPILQSVPESDPSKATASELAGRIDVRDVSFRYRKDGPQVLKDISLSIAPGEFVALVGPSGSGKSTLFRLLLGFEKPESGAISFDGQDMTTLDISSIRQQMGVVLQNSTLFRGDIFSNITCSAPYSLDDAWEAARMAGLEGDLQAMPMGMHTVVGEGGAGLSGGQRQRLMIARAVAGKPRILLFDEATSALDNHTQEKVSRNLEQLRSTRLVIAHRLTTVMNADRILVIENGSLVQSGTYEDLLAQPGPFAELARRQLT